ncbi:MAG: SpaA isopeptide-forming pilin-related protein [Terrisporobacter sp.]|uniref:SpaA isopeptide-forming pilin-related protein n=1 Tax=Terrisporobacter sp. TaxID=1965305 RepID=UPI002FCA5108
MSIVSGLALLSLDRTIKSLNDLTPIPGLAITLINVSTNKGASILTDSNGKFEFENVLPGNYLLMETYGVSNTFDSPYDFSKAQVIQSPYTSDPDISLIKTELPEGTNKIDSLTPNNITLSINNIDYLNQNFIDGPLIYIPISTLDHIIAGPNLITLVNNGTFGLNPPGTFQNNSPLNDPYPYIAPSFGYQQYSNDKPNDGNVSIVNIETLGSFNNGWWNLTNITTGNEVGNFLIVNGDNPGKSIFTETVNVLPSSYYVFYTWIANQIRILGKEDPKFTIKVTGNTGSYSEVIFEETSAVIPTNTNVPEWRQVGAVFNSKEFETVIVDIISDGKAAAGNDYAIDYISLQQVSIDTNIIESSKNVVNKNNPSSSNATSGDTLIYTVSISNISPNYDLTSVNVTDTISNDVTLVANSVVGGTLVSSDTDKVLIISVGTITKGNSTSVSFEVTVNQNASSPIISNQAIVNGKISIDPELLPTPVSIATNIVDIYLDIAILDIKKSSSHEYLELCSVNTYTITISNNSSNDLSNVIFYDTLPCELAYVENSLYVNSKKYNIRCFNDSVSLGTIPGNSKTIIKFNTKAICMGTNSSISNKACITCNIDNNTISECSNISIMTIVTSNINYAHLSLNNFVSSETVGINGIVSYGVEIYNDGTGCAENVLFNNMLPSQLSYQEGSLYVNCNNVEPYTIEDNLLVATLPCINPNSYCIVEFDAFVSTVYDGNVINTSTVSYNFVDCCKYSETLSASGSIGVNVVSVPDCNISLDESALFLSMKLYTTNTYTITISNNTLEDLKHVVFYSDLVPELIYKPYSFMIDDKGCNVYSLDEGVYIGVIPSNDFVVIKFKVRLVNSGLGSVVNNQSSITYLTSNNINPMTMSSNICSVTIISSTCNQ